MGDPGNTMLFQGLSGGPLRYAPPQATVEQSTDASRGGATWGAGISTGHATPDISYTGLSTVANPWAPQFATLRTTPNGGPAEVSSGAHSWSKPFDASTNPSAHPAFATNPPTMPPPQLPVQRPPDDANQQQQHFSVFGNMAYFAQPQQAGPEQFAGRAGLPAGPSAMAGNNRAVSSSGFNGSFAGYVSEALVTDPSEYFRRLQGIPTPCKRCPQGAFANAELRREYQIQKTCMLMSSQDLHGSKAGCVPETVHNKYFCICLLEDESKGKSSRFCGYVTQVYKALAVDEPYSYCLRRVDNFHVPGFSAVAKAIERWLKLDSHPSIVSLRHAFITNEFITGDEAPQQDQASLVFVYEYLPNASTLENSHFTKPCPENLLWVYICQLVLALQRIHSVGLAARVLEPSKILVSHRNRIHLNCVGILDALRHDPSCSLLEYQKQDLVALGRLILALANGSMAVLSDVSKAMERAFPASGGAFSNELKNLLIMLLSKPGQRQQYPTAHDLVACIHGRLAVQLEHQLSFSDALETEFMKEVDNGRLLKIVCKLGTICERAHFNNDPHWAETGDRYLCKLFRDYIFHQCEEHGPPHLDLGHIVDCLNKVDVGVPEKIMLMSRDGSSILVVSYMDIKRCIENAFSELLAASAAVPGRQ